MSIGPFCQNDTLKYYFFIMKIQEVCFSTKQKRRDYLSRRFTIKVFDTQGLASEHLLAPLIGAR